MPVTASTPRAFSLGAAISLSTGTMLPRDENEAHSLAGWLLGFPVWSQALPRAAEDLKRRVLAQHRNLPTELPRSSRQALEAFLAEQERRFGKSLIFVAGDPS